MTATASTEPIDWSVERDAEGHRTYKVTQKVLTNGKIVGPAAVLSATGLFATGSTWNIETPEGLNDDWAFCIPTKSVKRHRSIQKGEPSLHWEVESTFTTKPQFRCQDDAIEDPLLEPQKISGTFIKKREEINFNTSNILVKSSSHEVVHGPAVEFDLGNPTVHIEQNVSDLELDVFPFMLNTLNDAPLWGVPIRGVQLVHAAWERKYFGTCGVYFTRIFDFEVSFKQDTDGNFMGFNREIVDEGLLALSGHWDKTTGEWTLDNIGGSPPDPTEPTHFDSYIDKKGNPARTLLDGVGKPVTSVGTGPDFVSTVQQFLRESNFLLLGIPDTLGA